MVEIRESSSTAQRPKWYRGMIRKVGGAKDAVLEIVGGAELEVMEKDDSKTNGGTRPLLILNRTQQVRRNSCPGLTCRRCIQ